VNKSKEILAKFKPEDVVSQFGAKEILSEITLDEIEAYLKQRLAQEKINNKKSDN